MKEDTSLSANGHTDGKTTVGGLKDRQSAANRVDSSYSVTRPEIMFNSLDQNPPEAAKAGAVWHFARVRYSHFLPDRAYTLLPDTLPSSSSLSTSSTDDLDVPRTVVVGVSGGDAAHSRTCGARAAEVSFRSLTIAREMVGTGNVPGFT